MNNQQTVNLPPTVSTPPGQAPAAPASPTTPATPRFVPPQLTYMGKVAQITQGGGLGGSVGFP